MSAFVVDDRHIDVLIRTALDGPRDGASRWDNNFSYYFNGFRRIVHAENATEIGAMLLAENVRSVNTRYHESDDVPPYAYRAPTCRLTIVQALKAIQCLDYQACETDDWNQSEAYAFLRALESALIHVLPGMEAAPWGWTDELIATQPAQYRIV